MCFSDYHQDLQSANGSKKSVVPTKEEEMKILQRFLQKEVSPNRTKREGDSIPIISHLFCA